MRLKRAISSLILAIYLVASCGGMLSVILCHCDRSQHVAAKHHCCHCCSHSTGEGIKLPTSCCNHDHSTEIDLYNHEKSITIAHLPVICTTIPQIQEQCKAPEIEGKLKYLDRRKIPLPESEFAATRTLRAPPVIA